MTNYKRQDKTRKKQKIPKNLPDITSRKRGFVYVVWQNISAFYLPLSQSKWPPGLRCRSAAPSLLRLWVRIQQGAWMFVCSECCVLSGRGLCDEPITGPEQSYWLWCVVVRDLETSWMRKPWPTGGLSRQKRTNLPLKPAEIWEASSM